MNITHAKEEVVVGDPLKAIFERQSQLMGKYHDIELKSGLLQTEDCPVNLDDKKGQARIKDFAWRVTEELGEALDAKEDKEHFLEELIDGLHFLTELSILSGITPDEIISRAKKYAERISVSEIPKEEELPKENGLIYLCVVSNVVSNQLEAISLESKVTKFVENMGMTCNCLKNKPWKQSNMITDKEMFYDNLSKTWFWYLSILGSEMTAEEITMVYLKKSQVNIFRQRSNY